MREIPMEGDRLLMTPDEVLKRVDENTIGVVPTLGVTFTWQYEPVAPWRQRSTRSRRETGLDVPIHVDGAERRVHGAVRGAGPRLGLPPAARQVDQRRRATSSASRRWAWAG